MIFVNQTINQLLQQLINEQQAEEKLFYQDCGYSWQTINECADQMACRLLEAGMKNGDHVGIWSANSLMYISAFFAITKIGGVAVLINPAYKTYEMNRMVAYADLKGVFCDDACLQKIYKTEGLSFISRLDEKELTFCDDLNHDQVNMREHLDKRVSMVRSEDDACMLFTSGTTGMPKGVKLTHEQLLNVALRAVAAMHWQADDIICMSLPLFHSFGLSTGLLAALFHKGSVCLNNSYKSISVLKCIDQHHCTVLNGVPTMFLSLLNNSERANYDLSSLKSGIIAGSGVCEPDFLKVANTLQIPHLMQSYGQTEASPSITFSPYEDGLVTRAKSVGKAIDGVTIQIRDVQTGEDMPIGQSGEIVIRGFNTMQGYYKMPEETQKVFYEDGYMKTGDIGYLDESGYLHINCREREMIIRGGENISPKEIEDVLRDMKGVHQVKVFGVKEAVIQENIAACLIMDRPCEAEFVRQHVSRYLADYKVPKYVCFMDAFPETSNGKIDIKQLKETVKLKYFKKEK